MNLAALIMACVTWAVGAIGLAFGLSRRKPHYMGHRWLGLSWQLMVTALIFSDVAHYRNWPNRQQ